MQSTCAILYCHLWHVWLYHNFSTVCHKWQWFFAKKLLNVKCVFWSSLQILPETSHSEKNSLRYYHECTCLYATFLLFYQIWMKLEFSWQLFEKQPNIKFDVRGSVHHNINLIERTKRCDRIVEFIFPMFLNCSTCFGRNTVHHQELKICNCSLWFYLYFWLPAAAMAEPSQRQPATINVGKTRGCNFWAPDDGWCVSRNMLSN